LACGIAERREFHPGRASGDAHRADRGTSIRTPSMSISTEASAKSLPARIGVTESTVIETRLDPASFACIPSIGHAAIRQENAACLVNHNFPICRAASQARLNTGGSVTRPRAVDDFPAIRARMEVDLSLTEFRIGALLAAKAGNDVGYREIYDLVHGKDFVAGVGKEGYRANVRTLIRRIRKSFREVDPGFAQIENYAGFGYRWIPEE
jgi:hypothetical protein